MKGRGVECYSICVEDGFAIHFFRASNESSCMTMVPIDLWSQAFPTSFTSSVPPFAGRMPRCPAAEQAEMSFYPPLPLAPLSR
jgi:hypothetical protein